MRVCVCVCVCLCVHVCLYVCVYVCVFVCVYVHDARKQLCWCMVHWQQKLMHQTCVCDASCVALLLPEATAPKKHSFTLEQSKSLVALRNTVLHCFALFTTVLQCVALCTTVLQCVAVCTTVLQCVALCTTVLQCVAVCTTVLQCVAECVLLHFLAIPEIQGSTRVKHPSA